MDEAGCKQQVYYHVDQPAAAERTLFITEVVISNAKPVSRCPRGGQAYRFAGQSVDYSLPVHFWFRIQGASSLTENARGRGLDELKLSVVFYKYSAGRWRELGPNPKIILGEPIKIPEMSDEAAGFGMGKFDWRGDFNKQSGLNEPGLYHVELQIEDIAGYDVRCHKRLACSPVGRGKYIEFKR